MVAARQVPSQIFWFKAACIGLLIEPAMNYLALGAHEAIAAVVGKRIVDVGENPTPGVVLDPLSNLFELLNGHVIATPLLLM